MHNPTAAILVIGDEILSGRTRDKNMFYLAGRLSACGIDLKEARIVSDDRDEIVAAVNSLRRKYSHVFTSGGIGPTHDDITPDCIAEAFGVAIDVRDDARALLAAHYEKRALELTPARLRMARIPEGARLIDNPISAAPGFSLMNVHVMAGVPDIFVSMVEGVLTTLTAGTPLTSLSHRLERREAEIAEPLAALARAYPDLSIGSYPFREDGAYGVNVVIRGLDAQSVEDAGVRLGEIFDP